MAAARRSPPLVLNGYVDMDQLTGELGPEWILIKCIRRKAYGCGEHGQEIVEDLKLYLHPGDSPLLTSSMAIRLSDKALRAIDVELELGGPRKELQPHREIDKVCIIQIADQDFIVFTLIFRRPFRRDLIYCLVYDAIDSSLSLFKYLPDHRKLVCGPKPVSQRTSDGRSYELIIMARSIRFPQVVTSIHQLDVLCVCSPETRDFATGPWQIKGLRFPRMVPKHFCVDVAFSFKGKAFWADLSQGVVYCDPRTSGSLVDFDFINLPKECQLELEALPKDEPMKMTRTMGCVGDSIWLVRVKRYRPYANDTVTMWTLDLTEKEWREEKVVSAKELWDLDGFKEAGLPEVPPECPVLTLDGALSLVLSDQQELNEDDPVEDCICGFDMRLKNLLWHGRVHNYQITAPVIVPSDFFPTLRKRKRTEHVAAYTACTPSLSQLRAQSTSSSPTIRPRSEPTRFQMSELQAQLEHERRRREELEASIEQRIEQRMQEERRQMYEMMMKEVSNGRLDHQGVCWKASAQQ